MRLLLLGVRHFGRAPAAVAAASVLTLLGLFVWSRGGQTTTAVLKVRGSHVAAYVDGRLANEGELPMSDTGGIFLTLADRDAVRSLPAPRGIDRIRVTNPDGSVLFEDAFSSDPAASGRWKLVTGSVVERDGAVAGRGGDATIFHAGPSWRDYDVEVIARNVTALKVGVRASAPADGAVFTTTPFRHIDAHLFTVRGGEPRASTPVRLHSFREQRIGRSIAAMFVSPLPLAAGLLVLCAALALAASLLGRGERRPRARPRLRGVAGAAAVLALFFGPLPIVAGLLVLLGALALAASLLGRRERRPRARPRLPRFAGAAAALALSLLAGGIALRLMVEGGRVPHVPDELSYLFQAKLIASGHLAAEPPPSLAAFRWSDPTPIPVIDGKWASIYPFGHPLVLALGYLVQAPWLVPPLVGGASVFLLFLVGRRVYRAETALLAALLFAVSPFFLMTSSTFMSHTTAAFFLLAAIAFLAYAERSPFLFSLLAGVSLGLVINTRPLTGAALLPAFALLMLQPLTRRATRARGARCLVGFGLGCALMLAAHLLYRFLTTGDPLTTDPVQTGRDALGFSGSHTFAAGLSNEQTQTAYLMLVLHNWPVQLGVVLAFLPFVLGSTRRWDWFLGFAAASVMAAYTAYFYNGLMYGPRFWYEAAPLLILLSARGLELATIRIRQLATHSSGRTPSIASSGLAIAPAFVVACLAIVGSYRWVSGTGPHWGADFVPGRASDLRRFNGMDPAMLTAIRKARLPANSLVLVEPCPHWHCYGSVFWLNDPGLDGRTVYAVNLPSERHALAAAFPNRLVYRADYNARTIEPFPLGLQVGDGASDPK